MLNMIRGDAYRLRHSKGFYITEFFLIALVLIAALTETLGTIGVQTEALETFRDDNTIWNAVKAVKLMTIMVSFLIYLILPLFIMTTGFEFSRQSYKNLLSSGMTRSNYFFSKYAVFIVIVFLQFVLYYAAVYLGVGLKNGFGTLTIKFGVKISQTILLQFLFMIAIFSISILVIFITFSTITAIVTTIVFPILIQIIRSIFTKIDWIKYFDFQSSIDGAYFTSMSAHELTMYLTVACSTIIILGLLSIFIFKRKNL
ncbi:ABC transporter permease [Pediococcus ethanolidurans]|uniref:ABC transporter permease n=1 Tax=Pediococcus ethanolidurans TaxID=319653 RepID=UPI0021A9A384|nr:ABC transporter permease [Pediococcus ethanolidurans]MCT4398104.1 hypothetical protein [Pediococcus ethanolidurans]MCV3322530.1 ABC transporter permease [Pediococcus ethanolidurans]MCV3328429.1 ABC transporter permease [Pediococcus ethanolidurans]